MADNFLIFSALLLPNLSLTFFKKLGLVKYFCHALSLNSKTSADVQ